MNLEEVVCWFESGVEMAALEQIAMNFFGLGFVDILLRLKQDTQVLPNTPRISPLTDKIRHAHRIHAPHLLHGPRNLPPRLHCFLYPDAFPPPRSPQHLLGRNDTLLSDLYYYVVFSYGINEVIPVNISPNCGDVNVVLLFRSLLRCRDFGPDDS